MNRTEAPEDLLSLRDPVGERLLRARTIIISGEITQKLAERVTGQLLAMAAESDDDITVSRNHAIITRVPSGAALRDLGSLNGTYVNRRRIEGEEVLEDGDELQIGKYKLTYLAR